jgi:hypothetical protein
VLQAEASSDGDRCASSIKEIGTEKAQSSCCSVDSGSSSSSSGAGSYAELLSSWHMAPRQLQDMLLQACSCQVLAAGQVLQQPMHTSGSGVAATAGVGCYGVAAGLVLEVERKCESSTAAGAAVAAVQSTVLPRTSLTPQAAAAAKATAQGHADCACGMTMTPPTAAAAAAAGWQALREHVVSGSGASSAESGVLAATAATAAATSGAALAHQQGVLEGAVQATVVSEGLAGSSPRGFGSSSGSSRGAGSSCKWDELSAAVVESQRMKTAAFKALSQEVGLTAAVLQHNSRADAYCCFCWLMKCP